jgi:chromosome segregation ATPase
MRVAPVAGFILYIHPSSGPITPLEIDLNPVVLAGDSSPRNTTAAMARALAAQVEKRFSESRARENLPGFERVVPYLNQLLATYISGIVVRVPGIINDGSSSTSNSPSVQNRIAEIEQVYNERLKNEQDQHAQTRSQLFQMQISLNEAQMLLQEQLQLHGVEKQRLDDTQKRIEEAKKECFAERQEKARFELQLQLAQHRCGNLEKELTSVRDDLDSAREEAMMTRMDQEPLLKTIEELRGKVDPSPDKPLVTPFGGLNF